MIGSSAVLAHISLVENKLIEGLRKKQLVKQTPTGMRIPEISPTAGCAAQLESPLSTQGIAEHCATQALGFEHSINASFTRPDECLHWRTEFESSAGEFVQKALSSTIGEIRSLTSPNCNTSFCNLGRRNANALWVEQRVLSDREANCSNSYRSFKESYNITKPVFDDYLNINERVSEVLGGSSCNAYLDPIAVINAELNGADANDNQVNQYKGCAQPASNSEGSNAANDERRSTTVEDQKFNRFQDSRCAEFVHPSVETDFDDQSLMDLRDTYDTNDADDCITSATSHSISWDPSKHTYYPRGIINPNYPGFQHLAHTLSEHFIGNLPSDSYDSDISENEMELSADSFDGLPDDGDELKYQWNSYTNNNNNSNHSTVSIEKISQENSSQLVSPEENNVDPNFNSKTLDVDMSIKLQLMLSLLEPSKCCKPTWKVNEVRASKTLESEDNPLDMHREWNGTSEKCECVTPDILIENYKTTPDNMKTQENRPDLLRGVSPRPIASARTDGATFTKNQKLLFVAESTDSEVLKDESVLGVTPVDIIGDFGREVEREFGLLVSGYRRLTESSLEQEKVDMQFVSQQSDKLADAVLSIAKDQIDSTKFLAALGHSGNNTECNHQFQLQILNIGTATTSTMCEYVGEGKVAALSSGDPESQSRSVLSPRAGESSVKEHESITPTGCNPTRKYQRPSYDERQLPPVAIDYKRCNQNMRNARRQPSIVVERLQGGKSSNLKVARNHGKLGFSNRFLNSKRSSNTDSRRHEEAELNEYHQLISNKELILSNSRYTKNSSWAQYLKNSVKDGGADNTSISTDLISLSTLDLFDAYKIGTEIDVETLQKHFKMAKEIEKKRRSDREEIRRRLAIGTDENTNEPADGTIWKPILPSRIHTGVNLSHFKDASSDTESHSSDSETCPKLSKVRQQNKLDLFGLVQQEKAAHPNHERPPSLSCLKTDIQLQGANMTDQWKQQQSISNEDKECDFFTKQARLQIEARMALAQAKGMAHMQMEIDKQHQRVSPITELIRESLEKVGVQMAVNKRRVSRQMLTDMSITQLQILVNNLHTHIEDLNESLVHFLLERDDLHLGQDVNLADIEELTRYISAQEQLAQQK